jgi:ribosome-associated toxin RatA of RatAB toxin-antitoxin module
MYFDAAANTCAVVRRVLLAALLCSTGAAIAGDSDIRVSAATEGAAVRVDAYALLHAPWSIVWQTLTDYDHLGSFIPGMTTSRVIRREGVAAIVEQTGEARVLMISFPLNVTVSSAEYPPNSIRIHALTGNLRRLEGGYEISAGDGGTVELRWRGKIEPASVLPAIFTRPVLRAVVEAQFRGMVSEIQRRTAAANQ